MLLLTLGIGKYPKKGITSPSHTMILANSQPAQDASANHRLHPFCGPLASEKGHNSR
jgi:hypothetical protein